MTADCLDCALADCWSCAESNDEWYGGGCCCGHIRPRPVDDEDDEDYEDDDA